jgi:hypothetical protein
MNFKITVEKVSDTAQSAHFKVVIESVDSTTTHDVMVPKSYWRSVTHNHVGINTFVKDSFEFLLKREPQESILPSFEIQMIERYFPEYEQTLRALYKK